METENEKQTAKNWKVGDGTAGPGRPKGVPNKSTQIVRDAIAQLLERNAPQMDQWLNQVAQEDPYKALDLMNKLCEYHIPKLARTELTGKDGGDIKHRMVGWMK